MIDEILAFTDKIGKLLSTFKVDLILGIIVNLIIIQVLFKMTEILMRKVQNKFSSNDKTSPINHIVPVIERIIKFLIVFIIAASFLQSRGYSLTSLIAGFGITGLAVGFAAQQAIAAIFGTISILTDKVYKQGDYIKVKDVEGTVESITLRSTKIRTLDNFLITVPNDICADSIVENVSRAGKRKIDVTFGLIYGTSNEKLQRAMDIVKEVIAARSDMHKDFHIFINELADSSINIRFFGYAKTKSVYNLWQIRGSIYQEVIRRYREEGIEFAFPTQTVYIEK